MVENDSQFSVKLLKGFQYLVLLACLGHFSRPLGRPDDQNARSNPCLYPLRVSNSTLTLRCDGSCYSRINPQGRAQRQDQASQGAFCPAKQQQQQQLHKQLLHVFEFPGSTRACEENAISAVLLQFVLSQVAESRTAALQQLGLP